MGPFPEKKASQVIGFCLHLIQRCYMMNSSTFLTLSMFSVGPIYTWQNHFSFLHAAQVQSELLGVPGVAQVSPSQSPKTQRSVYSAPAEPLPRTQVLLTML